MQEKAVKINVSLLEKVFRTIVSIGILVAAFLLAMDIVNAEEYDLQPFDESFYDYIDTTYHITGSQGIFSSLNDVPEETWQYVEVSNNSDILGFIYNDNRLDVSNFSVTSNAYNTNELRYVTWDGRQSMCSTYDLNYSNVICYLLDYKVGNSGTRIYKINFGAKSYLNGSSNPYTKCSVTRTMLYTYNWQSYNSESVYGVFNLTDTLKFYNYRPTFGYCDTPYGWWTAIGTGTKGTHIELQHRPTMSTTGFTVFKYNNLGTDTLRIVPPKNQVPVGTHSSNESTVTFDLVIDGTTIPCEYNSESTYYYESLEYGRAYYEIPLNVLLPSSIDGFNEVYLTNVRYVNTWSNQGGESGTNTFWYVDKCYLKRSIGNDDIGQVSITHDDTDTGYSDTEINNINTMITNASTLQGTFDVEKNLSGGSTTPFSFSSFQDAVVREIECWHPTGTKDSDWLSITIDNITYDSGDNMYWLEYDSNSTQSFEHRYNYNVSPYSYVRENNYSGYYDIIYFIVHEQVYDSSGSGFSTLDQTYTRYYYFVSDRYYNKLILYREMDILTYIKLNNEIGEKTYNYLFDRLLNIDDNLYYYIKDKAVIDNDILDALEDIDNDMQFNLDIVVDLLNKILNAILELDIEPTDTTAIETKLDEIYTRLGNSNLNNDWYAGYRDWLYNETDNNVVDMPHEWFVDKINDVKNIYDIFGNTDLHSYYTEMRKVISGISGNSNSYYFDLYFNTGIRSNDFDLHTFSSYNEGGFQ